MVSFEFRVLNFEFNPQSTRHQNVRRASAEDLVADAIRNPQLYP